MPPLIYTLITIVFVVVSISMILIILVQRPQGGGLAGAFGGAGGGAGTETVFGGRIGDALTWATIAAFALYLTIAISLNKLDSAPAAAAAGDDAEALVEPEQPGEPVPPGFGDPLREGGGE